MNLLALILFGLYLMVAFGLRTIVHRRRTGDSAWRFDAGPVGGVRRWAKLAWVAAAVVWAAGPVAGLAGMPSLAVLDHAAVRWLGLAVALAGITATVVAQLAMGDSWRIGLDPGEHTTLVTGGPFALVRNPIFTGMLATCAGLTAMTGNLVAVLGLAAVCAAVEVQVRVVEEPYLRHTHGHAYAQYAARVGRFWPGLGRLRPPITTS